MESISVDENLSFVESIFNTDDLVQGLEKEEDRQLLNSAIENLDTKYREVLILKFIEDKDYNEISDILEKPMGSIATLINRGKKSLKKEFEKLTKKEND
jgi:RNA polymerase sigma-70 factor (ECF subfamily)